MLKEYIPNEVFDAGLKDDNLVLVYKANEEVSMAGNTPSGLSERVIIKNCVLQGEAAAEVGSAAVLRHSDKMTKYFSDCDREGIPIVVEALGCWHSDAAAAVSKLARQLASHTREEEETTRYLFQRLSLLLMRGNAALILNRTPFHVSAEVDGDQDFDT